MITKDQKHQIIEMSKNLTINQISTQLNIPYKETKKFFDHKMDYEKNKKRYLQMASIKRQNNKEYFKNYNKIYYLKNKTKIKKENTKRRILQYKTNPLYKLNSTLRKRLNNIIINIKLKKLFNTGKIDNLIGCSIEYLKQHLESKFQPGMSWSNHSYRGWHIDHIIPCAKFDLTNEDQRKQCFHWSNLQPLWMMDNLAKGDICI